MTIGWLFFNTDFDGHDAQKVFATGWPLLPMAIVVPYLAFVYWVPHWMKNRPPFDVRVVARVWNIALAVFSICGAFVCVPHLAEQLYRHGFWYCACADVYELAGYGAPALWAAAFSWSKLFELFDTVLLILKKRPVRTLHWFHHASVVVFVWATWAYENPLALWFGAMNYTVHSVMYSYFALTSSNRWRAAALRIAPAITLLQISQFAMGTILNGFATVAFFTPDVGCATKPAILQLSGLMYLLYGGMFMQLFVNRYVTGTKPGRASAQRSAAQERCGAAQYSSAALHARATDADDAEDEWPSTRPLLHESSHDAGALKNV